MHELIETNPLTVLSINDFLYCDFLVVPAVLKALAYEEMRGSYSVGKLSDYSIHSSGTTSVLTCFWHNADQIDVGRIQIKL